MIITYAHAGASLGGQNISACNTCGALVNDSSQMVHTAWHVTEEKKKSEPVQLPLFTCPSECAATHPGKEHENV